MVNGRLPKPDDDQPISDKDARKLGYQIIKEPLDGNPFEDSDADEDDTEYCEQCRDRHEFPLD